MKRRRKYNKKKIALAVLLFILLIIIFIVLSMIINKDKAGSKKNTLFKNTTFEIKEHYNSYVKTNKEAILYNKNKEEVGKIGKNIELSLEETNITSNTKYFNISDFDKEYFIKYEDVDKIEELSQIDDRYKKYIVFNENIITQDITNFYDKNNNLVYSFNKSFDLPIIIKDDNKYGVELNNKLLYVLKDNTNEIKESNNTDKTNSSGIAVLNYHFSYDDSNSEESKLCNEEICASKSQLKSHLDYFNDNNILTIKMNELEMYMDGKIKLPKSVLITIDDGGRTKVFVDLLGDYKMYATIFLITSWYNPDDYYKNDYIEFHSHSHDLHVGGKCPGGQGGAIKCLDRQVILEDLKKSREILHGSTAFCYPFYEFNDYSTKLVKEAGFTMAFIGEQKASYGPYKLAEVGGDKMKIPRFVVVTYTTLKEFDKYFNEIK